MIEGDGGNYCRCQVDKKVDRFREKQVPYDPLVKKLANWAVHDVKAKADLTQVNAARTRQKFRQGTFTPVKVSEEQQEKRNE